jgi:hypothetical protein
MITDSELLQLRKDIYLALVAKSGVREWEQTVSHAALWTAAVDAADGLLGITGEITDMATSIALRKELNGTPKQIVFADHAGDFNPTAANDLRKTTDGSQELDVQLSLASVANAAYRQSAKFDFGSLYADEYDIRGAIEHAATPTAGNAWDLYLSYSTSGTAATGNSGGASGTDSAYTGYSSNAAAAVRQLHYIGSLVCTSQATGTVQVMEAQNSFSPKARYASLIILDGSGAAVHSDDVECNVVFNPVVLENQ